MVALSRLGLFVFVYLTIFFISAAVEQNIEKHFQGYVFLIITFALFGWIFSCQLDKSSPRDLKEILYVMTFLTAFTSLGSFIGICKNEK